MAKLITRDGQIFEQVHTERRVDLKSIQTRMDMLKRQIERDTKALAELEDQAAEVAQLAKETEK